MPYFSKKSLNRLCSVHKDLQILLKHAINYVDFSVLCGYRSWEEQQELYNQGKSKVMGGASKHNLYPSMAVDIAPYPYPKTEKELRQLYYLQGMIKGFSIELGIDIRLGADWNRDNEIRNDKFQDAWHIELIKKKGGHYVDLD